MKKLSQFLKSHILGTLEAILLKFGVWNTEVGRRVHSKNRFVSLRQYRAMEVRKSCFLFSCQYTHGYYAPASWAARLTTVCLDLSFSTNHRHVTSSTKPFLSPSTSFAVHIFLSV